MPAPRSSLRLLLAIVVTITSAACGVVGETDTPKARDESALGPLGIERAYPNRSGGTRGTMSMRVGEAIEDLEYTEIDGEHVTEGDILLPGSPAHLADLADQDDLEPGERTSSANGVPLWRRWVAGVVPYAISSKLSRAMRQRIFTAMSMWSGATPVFFKQRLIIDRDYVFFRPGSGCSSYIGRRGGRQNVNLSGSCSTGNIAHEIGHALGLWHEQSRSDRGKHIKIHWANIEAKHEHNFRVARLGIALTYYDTKSIMHYSSTAFSSNGKPTITRLDGKRIKANRSYLTRKDIAGVSWMYR